MLWEVEGRPSAEEWESAGTVVAAEEEIVLLRDAERKSWPGAPSSSPSPKIGRRDVPGDESKMPDIVAYTERASRETTASIPS